MARKISFQSRNLSKDDLGGVIFGCTSETMRECLDSRLFGLPGKHISYVKNIEPGLPLFLFNYRDRRLHGIFEAETRGKENINPHAWSHGLGKTNFSAQVRIRTRLQCEPLLEEQFKKIIQENYYSGKCFCFELDNTQTNALILLFKPSSLIEESSKWIPKVVVNTGDFLEFKDSAEVLSAAVGNFEQNQSLVSHTDVEIENEEQTVYGMKPLEDGNASEASNQLTIHQLEQEMKSLKLLSHEQLQKMSLMENNLTESKLEIQQIKDRLHVVESCLDNFQKTSCNAHLRSVRIFLVGGSDGHSQLFALDDYSPSTDTLRSIQPMRTIQLHAAAAALAGQIYIFGGKSGNTCSAAVVSYNPQSNEWTSCSPLSAGKGNLAGVALHGKLFAIGGGNEDYYFSDVEMFDPGKERWIHTNPMLEKRFDPASATLNSAIYTAGGYNGEDYLKSAERFDPRESSWKYIPMMNTRRGCHSLIAFNEKLYAIGGYNGTEAVSSMEVLDPRFGSWANSHPMNLSRAYAGAVAFKDSIYMMGGLKTETDYIDTVEYYKADNGWLLTDLKAIGKRCFFSAIVL